MTTAAPGEGLFASLKQLALTLLAMGKTRLALLANEVEEEKLRLGRLLGLGVATLFLAGLCLILMVAFATVALWEYRVVVVGLFTLLVGLAAWLAWRALCAEIGRKSNLLQASLAELEADVEALKQSLARSGDGG